MTLPERGGGRLSAVGPAIAGTRNLILRIASSAILVPIVLLAAYFGGWIFLVLWALAAAGILWEWSRLVTGHADLGMLAPGAAALLGALLASGLDAPDAAVGAIIAGAVVAGLMGTMNSVHPPMRWLWAGSGIAYAGIAYLAPALLRHDAKLGFLAFVFLAVTVWLTDVFAYAVGRTVGGALLWPRVSPNKTWAGAFGGLFGGVAGAIAVAYASGLGRLGIVGVVALALSLSAQAGDLLESAIKRQFGAKDTGRLIPGHGGLMDRLDGFLVAALVALLIGLIHTGTDAPATGLLVW
jgi:phosphatidate cytidylyltransferase